MDRIICQHVAEDPQIGLHGDRTSNRICCPACFKKGFLRKILRTWEENGKTIGEIKK